MLTSNLFLFVLWAGFGLALASTLGEYLAYFQTKRERYAYPALVNLLRKAAAAVYLAWAVCASALLVDAPSVVMHGVTLALLSLVTVFSQPFLVYGLAYVWRKALSAGAIGVSAGAVAVSSYGVNPVPGLPVAALLACFGAGGALLFLAQHLNALRGYELYRQD